MTTQLRPGIDGRMWGVERVDGRGSRSSWHGLPAGREYGLLLLTLPDGLCVTRAGTDLAYWQMLIDSSWTPALGLARVPESAVTAKFPWLRVGWPDAWPGPEWRDGAAGLWTR